MKKTLLFLSIFLVLGQKTEAVESSMAVSVQQNPGAAEAEKDYEMIIQRGLAWQAKDKRAEEALLFFKNIASRLSQYSQQKASSQKNLTLKNEQEEKAFLQHASYVVIHNHNEKASEANQEVQKILRTLKEKNSITTYHDQLKSKIVATAISDRLNDLNSYEHHDEGFVSGLRGMTSASGEGSPFDRELLQALYENFKHIFAQTSELDQNKLNTGFFIMKALLNSDMITSSGLPAAAEVIALCQQNDANEEEMQDLSNFFGGAISICKSYDEYQNRMQKQED